MTRKQWKIGKCEKIRRNDIAVFFNVNNTITFRISSRVNIWAHWTQTLKLKALRVHDAINFLAWELDLSNKKSSWWVFTLIEEPEQVYSMDAIFLIIRTNKKTANVTRARELRLHTCYDFFWRSNKREKIAFFAYLMLKSKFISSISIFILILHPLLHCVEIIFLFSRILSVDESRRRKEKRSNSFKTKIRNILSVEWRVNVCVKLWKFLRMSSSDFCPDEFWVSLR